MADHLRDRLLGRWGEAVARRPLITLGTCVALAIASIATALFVIDIKADRNDLIDQDVPWAARYAKYRDDFPRWDDLVICLEGDAHDPAVDNLARALAEHLADRPRIDHAVAGFTADQVGPRLWRTADRETFDATLSDLARARAIAEAPTAADALVALMQQDAEGAVTAEDLLRGLGPYIDALEGRPVRFDMGSRLERQWQPMATDDGRIRLVTVGLSDPDGNGVAGLVDDLAWLRATIRQWLESRGHGDLPWGVTGIPAIETDETRQATQDATIASILAFVLVTVMLVIVFHRPRLPLMAASALVIGIAWSFGWVAVSIGHLQLLSMVFSAILIGLGIDFALHLVARMRHIEHECADITEATSRAFREVGPGLLTGAITTALAFGCTAFTSFLGVAEMGIIAAGGVLLCLVAVMCAFPAFMACSPSWRRDLAVMRPVGDSALSKLAGPLRNRSGWFVLGGAVVTGALLAGASRVQYDSNVLNLQPAGLEAVSWQNRLAAVPGTDLWSGLVVTTHDAAPELVERLRTVAGVSEVGGMGLLFPRDLRQRQEAVAAVRDRVLPPWQGRDNLGFIPTVLDTIRAQVKSTLETAPHLAPVVDALATALGDWRGLDRDVPERRRRIATLEQAWDRDHPPLETWITAALAPPAPAATDLPVQLRALWIGTGGQWLLRVAPVIQERSILGPERLGPFVESIRTVAPDVLGPPVQIYESSRMIVHAYSTSGLLAIIVVLVVLLLDFRSIPDALTAMLPVCIGFVGAFGFMGFTGLSLNFANLMILPMIFGIGVDSGVHVVHRWRSDRQRGPAGLWGGTGTGILLTTVTTAIAFGSLMIAEHRGVRSLAIVMVVGLTTTLVACWTVLPATLTLRTRFNPRSDDPD